MVIQLSFKIYYYNFSATSPWRGILNILAIKTKRRNKFNPEHNLRRPLIINALNQTKVSVNTMRYINTAIADDQNK